MSSIISFGNITKLNGDFSFGVNENYYIRFITNPVGIDKKFINIIGVNNNSLILTESISIDEGNIEWSSIDINGIIKLDFPKLFTIPSSLSLAFIETDDDRLYKFFMSWIEATPLIDFKSISPVNLDKYSADVMVYRYDNKNEKGYFRKFTIFPKTLPKYSGSNSGTLKKFDIEFYIVDFEEMKYFTKKLSELN